MAEEMELNPEQITAVTEEYGEEQIQVLEGLEAVRKRPEKTGFAEAREREKNEVHHGRRKGS